jgi:hypothetical protein
VNKCGAEWGNLIYLDGLNLSLIVDKTSFNYDYSLINWNDLVGFNRINNSQVFLREYLCPLRKGTKTNEFDCDKGCYEYLV